MSGAHQRLDLTYGDYLGLDKLRDAQHPRSGSHDELLFIIVHQASELWMKLSIHELARARDRIAADDLGSARLGSARHSR